jgi:hypothetical protein
MSDVNKDLSANAIRDAIREKRERKPKLVSDIEALEVSLLADIETFDLDAAERRARLEHSASGVGRINDHQLEFPEIVPTPVLYVPKAAEEPAQAPLQEPQSGGLLGMLRQQADQHRRSEQVLSVERSASNRLIDESLKYIFFYLHDLVQQLNTLKPVIPRAYVLTDNLALVDLAWQEGFADYRTQSQSAGAMMELVTFTFQLTGAKPLVIERDGTVAERFRSSLFDYGLKFSCQEFKNERRYVERAEFKINSQLSVSLRWRADFERGVLVFETRNFERLGISLFNVKPSAIDFALLEELGKLVLGQNSRFRELAKR